MDLSGFSILDIYGAERISLNGEYTADSLAEVFIEQWIPYFECHKCGRWDYCKYVERHPRIPNRALDIKCGVVVESLRNFVQATFSILDRLEGEQVQRYLDGAFYFCRTVYDVEQYIGGYLNPAFREWFGELAPRLFGLMIRVRDNLNMLGCLWKDIPEFRSKRPVLFVEGYAEKEFLDEMRKSHLVQFLDLKVEVYGGKGNRRSKRIQMLFDKYKEQGYKIFALGDADGDNTDIFRSLIQKRLVEAENTFVFAHDFETSIPLPLLHAALVDMEFLVNMTQGDFETALGGTNGSVVHRLKSNLRIDIEPNKLELAVTVARILDDSGIIWCQEERFLNESELGQFLRFVQRII